MYNTIISARDLAARFDNEAKLDQNWVIFDCRFSLADPNAGETAFLAGHIPGAQFLDMNRDLAAEPSFRAGRHPLPDADELATKLAAAGVTAGKQVIVYDDCGGAMAGRAWWLLRWLGHAEVAVLDGGLAAWQAEGGILETEVSVATASHFSARLQNSSVLSVEQLQAEMEQIQLVDARAGERYRGEREPIDPVAGHVPGALNRPLTDNLDEGYFKSASQLRQEWLQVLGHEHLDSGDAVVHMCGSGITACHNLLAMEIAGLSGSRLYAGSWSEWIKDISRPIAKG